MTQQTTSTREVAQQKYNTARSNLLIVIIFTVVNIAMILLNTDVMMLFSATIPYFSVAIGYYSGESVLYAIGIGIAVATLLGYFLCWFLSKKHYGWMIAALVFFIIDTLALAGIYLFAQDFSGIVDALNHISILFYLVTGVINGNRLAKMPEEIQENTFIQEQPIITETSDEENEQ